MLPKLWNWFQKGPTLYVVKGVYYRDRTPDHTRVKSAVGGLFLFEKDAKRYYATLAECRVQLREGTSFAFMGDLEIVHVSIIELLFPGRYPDSGERMTVTF